MTDSETQLRPGSASGPAAASFSGAAAPRHAVLHGRRAPEFLRDETLAEIFAATVAVRGLHAAMITLERRLNYTDVNRQAEALARGLVAAGARPGKAVGLWMGRGPELLIGQIAIAKTGAAWLPFDADAPVDRVATCLGDAEAVGLLVSDEFAAKTKGHALPCPLLLDSAIPVAAGPPVDARALGATPDDPAYMIYTSGSTGVPKGIVITGRNICHYLRSANHVYGVNEHDIVFQGASVAFDLSMEEIWIPYLVGATLFVATPQIMGEADKLPDVLDDAGVTVLDTVPTLLAMMPGDVPRLRTIILGGEACPPSVAARWCRAGRKIFNSYGPTEATVVATVAEVKPDEPVTIGGPIPNYTCYVADDALRLLDRGTEGELLIGGPGVARGYLRRDELTAEKFVRNPFASDGRDPILYRSGDAVVLDEDGNIAFRGRIDDQVKIRGFRVELGEIEARLASLPGVSQAAVVLRNEGGIDELVAFLVLERGATLDAKAMRHELREHLPPYMVPGRYENLTTLPRLPSGKADRKTLKALQLTAAAPLDEQEEPRTETEAVLLDAARRALPPQAIPFDADFFTDLGGHSLVAARFVSAVRLVPRLAGITLQDVYKFRTLRAIAEHLDGRAASMAAPRDLSFTPAPLLRRFLCGCAQAVVLPVIFALMTAQWLGVFVSYMLLTDPDATLFQEMISLLGVYMCINIATVAVSIAGKWLVLGRTKPGRYPLWGVYYYRWWLAQRLIALTHAKWFQASPIMRLFVLALGGKVGEDALISEFEAGAIDLVSIGAGATLGTKLKLANARVEGNELIIGTIEIGDDAYIGTSVAIEEGVVIGEGAQVEDLTSVAAGTQVPAHAIYDGSPGRITGAIDPATLPAPARASQTRRSLLTFAYTVLLLIVPPLGLLPIFPAFWVFDRVDASFGFIDRSLYLLAIPLMAWPTSFVLILLTVGLMAIIRWLILPRVKEGRYSVFSFFYLRKWAVALATEITLETLSSLFATIYMRTWYRLMGAHIGKDSEISTNIAGRYDIVDIGDKCFIADEVILGDEDIRRGWMHLARVKTGARVFVGNDAVVPPGAIIPDGALIGVKSKPPANEVIQPGDTWFGSPPIRLPVRQKMDAGGATWTYEPPFWKKAMRATFEAVNISLPTMLYITFGTWSVEVFADKLLGKEYLSFLALFILCCTAISIGMTFIVIGIKWATMGRYEPQIKPMWSFWAMRTEAVAVLYWGLAGRVFLDHLRGTPFLPWMLRLFGSKFGKGVFMDATDITEFDCVKVGDYAALNMSCVLQTHLYEDRVMKIGRIDVGRGVTVGAGSTILYDTHCGEFARLGPLTVLMKGESLPPHSEWIGAPAEPKPA
jgi:non-ribosomal peptide synthetase-like protein